MPWSGAWVTGGVADEGFASDDALARAAALGDRDAFEAIVHRHGLPMYRYARRMLVDDGDAQEVVQDAFVGAWKGLDHFGGRSSLRTWLFGLTAHKAVDRRRRRARPQPIDDRMLSTRPAGPGSDPLAAATTAELAAALDRALAELPYRQRACWLLVEIEGLSQPEAAHVLSMSAGAVRGQLFRARRNLAERMARWR